MIDEPLFKNPFLLAVIPALIIACVNYLAASTTKIGSVKAIYYEKRFLDFYHPVFIHLETYLFRQISYDEAMNIHAYLAEMIDNHHMLINYRIIDRHFLMKKHLESKIIDRGKFEYVNDFHSICRHLDADITFLQNKLGLPTRGFIYRINHKQLTFNCLFYGRVLAELLESFVIPFFFILGLFFLSFYMAFYG